LTEVRNKKSSKRILPNPAGRKQGRRRLCISSTFSNLYYKEGHQLGQGKGGKAQRNVGRTEAGVSMLNKKGTVSPGIKGGKGKTNLAQAKVCNFWGVKTEKGLGTENRDAGVQTGPKGGENDSHQGNGGSL